MGLSNLIRVAEKQRELLHELLSNCPLTNSEGHIDAIERLSSIYSENLATVETIRKKSTESLERDCRPILDKAKKLSDELAQGQFPFVRSCRKSFEAIYVSAPARESETKNQQSQKNKQHERSLKLQELGCDQAMVFAGTMSTSEWAQRLSGTKLEYILRNIPRPQQECLPALLKHLDTWVNEQPLRDCAAFRNSLTALHSSPNETLASEPELPIAGIIQNIQHAPGIHYGFSNIPFEKIPLICDKLLDATMHSRQLEMERRSGAPSSLCVNIFISDDEQTDGSFTARIQRDMAFQMRRDLMLETFKWS